MRKPSVITLTTASLLLSASALAHAANFGTLHFQGALTNPTCRAHSHQPPGHGHGSDGQSEVVLTRCGPHTAQASGQAQVLNTATLAAQPYGEAVTFRGAGSTLAVPSSNSLGGQDWRVYQLQYH